ncbi:topoisomerase [Bacillus cereus group sp. BfR-BA-01445]|uniref:topoisomerase n=1 Tax=Bacillus cereus group sp. BfR-BA-01445 TaxID=2920349 RepID=UPI001F560CC4|nr:topoisomerase [Bacillus cereus group sp. BfR-BA-01445]
MGMKREDVIQYIEDNKDEALKRVSKILGKETKMPSFNGIVGGKNTTYDVNPLDYNTAERYVAAWMLSHEKRYNDEVNASYSKSSHRVYDLLQDSFVKEFIENYLARTYFNKHY